MANGQTIENGLPQRAGTTNPDWDAYVPRGEGRTDEQIRADIHEKLARESGEHTRSLSLEVKNGIVTLRGGASTPAERQRIEALVRSVPSVRGVQDELSPGRAEAHTRGHDAARDRALEGVHAAQRTASDLSMRTQDYVQRVGAQAQDYAQRLGARAQDYAHAAGMRTMQGGRQVGDFVATHAVPLALVGASLAFLVWSIQRDAQRSASYPYAGFET